VLVQEVGAVVDAIAEVVVVEEERGAEVLVVTTGDAKGTMTMTTEIEPLSKSAGRKWLCEPPWII
jgi:hypothetical protein